MNSRAKGKRGELELAAFLRERGFDGARRGQQYSGTETSADVVCPSLPGVHLECKRVEAGNPYGWLAQAIRDSEPRHGPRMKMPVVAHKRNGKEWIAVLRLEDLLDFIRKANVAKAPQ